jgi:hypothetical protein
MLQIMELEAVSDKVEVGGGHVDMSGKMARAASAATVRYALARTGLQDELSCMSTVSRNNTTNLMRFFSFFFG